MLIFCDDEFGTNRNGAYCLYEDPYRCLQNKPAFRLELIGALILVPVALWLGDSGLEKSILISAVFAVLVVEIINSAIEAAIDRVGPELNDLSRRAKDLGSAAVLLTLINVLVVWALVLADQII